MNIIVLDKVRLPDGSEGVVSQWEGDGLAKVYMGPSKFGNGPHFRYIHKGELTKIN